MSIFIGDFEKINDNKLKVKYINSIVNEVPNTIKGEIVNTLPIDETAEGKMTNGLYFNPNTKELWYEYIDIPKTLEQIQQEALEGVQMQLFQAQTELLISKTENEKFGEQLFNLQTNLMTKGVI